MATLWHKLVEDNKLKHTNKAFYDKYVYALTLSVDRAHLLSDWYLPKFDLLKKIETYENPILLWGITARSRRFISDSNRKKLINIVKFLSDNKAKHDLKTTCSYDRLYAYSNDQSLIKQLITKFAATSRDVISVSIPKSSEHSENLLRGNVYSESEFKFRILTNTRKYSIAEKTALKSALQGYLDTGEIHVANSFLVKLSNYNLLWTNSTNIYTNDDRVHMMLNLICPNFVRKIYPLLSANE